MCVCQSAQHLRVLQDEYESELQSPRLTNLLHLLISDAPLTSSSVLIPNPNLIENSSNELRKEAQSCSSGPVEAQNISARLSEVTSVVSVRGAYTELNGVQATGATDKQDVCTGIANTAKHR